MFTVSCELNCVQFVNEGLISTVITNHVKTEADHTEDDVDVDVKGRRIVAVNAGPCADG